MKNSFPKFWPYPLGARAATTVCTMLKRKKYMYHSSRLQLNLSNNSFPLKSPARSLPLFHSENISSCNSLNKKIVLINEQISKGSSLGWNFITFKLMEVGNTGVFLQGKEEEDIWFLA